jgi:hypothetical protein
MSATATIPERTAAPPWHLATSGGSHPQLAEIQRARITSAAIRAVDELGYSNVSVTHITAREMLLARMAGVVGEGREESARAGRCTPLIAEGLVGAALTILYTRLLRGESEPLSDLLGELMGMIVLPYLGPGAARREQTRPAPAAIPGHTREPAGGERLASDPLAGIPIRLTYRTARVLECVAAHPGASNRQVGTYAGVTDRGQISGQMRWGSLRPRDRPSVDALALPIALSLCRSSLAAWSEVRARRGAPHRLRTGSRRAQSRGSRRSRLAGRGACSSPTWGGWDPHLLEEAPSPAGTQPGGLGRRSHRSSIGPSRAGACSAGRRGPLPNLGPRRSLSFTFPRPLGALSHNNRGANVPSVLQEET